ncbi:MAG: TrmH family RNA methyltransferase [Flavobacteriales bacterium]
MFISKQISSLQNDFVKQVVSLHERKGRKQSGLFLIEGHREIERAAKFGWKLKELIFCSETLSAKKIKKLLPEKVLSEIEIIEVNKPVFEKLAYRDTGISLVATCVQKNLKLSDLSLKKNPLIVALEGLEKPGNVGAILRTADAAGVDAVLICNPLTDIYNPNIVRSSLGCLFTQNIAICNTDEAIDWLYENQIQITATHLEGAIPYHHTDFGKPTCIAMGTESSGLTDKWREASTELIKIPMKGEADSLNVSTSAAIVIYEAVRQRIVNELK